jgi:hypothetical protein
MPTPSLWLNTSGVAWTPTGSGTPTALNRITQAGLDWNQETINNRADLDIYDSSAHVVGFKPTVTFQGMNVHLYLNLTPGIGAITWKVGNADNQTGTGSVIWTMTPAMNQLGNYTGGHGAYATGGISFVGLAPDGLTNPASFSVVSAGALIPEGAQFAVKGYAGPRTAAVARSSFGGGSHFDPPVKGESAPDARPDAVWLDPARYAAGVNHFRNICRLQADGARMLGLHPDQVSVRSQGAARIVTPSPAFTILHPKDHDLAGSHRLAWHEGEPGVKLGFLTDEARESDQAAA